uniref:Uncharacterized protein n=1 Tax=Siphoviridae sp. ctgBD49 TaxID=2826420 RepID=A0A8S5QNQ9_9CAUD|nr:MAG TPA: hypothetical protein [Siphoviridae sp. ctgBD49]
MFDNELYHYGVLGMKWGIRKARKSGTNYVYKSHGQKKWERKLAKAQKQGTDTTEATNKLATYKARDRARQNYAAQTKTGHAIVRGILLGPIGAGSYNRARAAGAKVGDAVVSGILTNIMGTAGVVGTKYFENSSARRDAGVAPNKWDKRYGSAVSTLNKR